MQFWTFKNDLALYIHRHNPKYCIQGCFRSVLFSLFFNIGSGFATSWIRRDEVVLIYKVVIWAIAIVLNSPLDKEGERSEETECEYFPVYSSYIYLVYGADVYYVFVIHLMKGLIWKTHTRASIWYKFPISTLVMNQHTSLRSRFMKMSPRRYTMEILVSCGGGGGEVNFIIEWMWIHPHQTSRLSFTLEISKYCSRES